MQCYRILNLNIVVAIDKLKIILIFSKVQQKLTQTRDDLRKDIIFEVNRGIFRKFDILSKVEMLIQKRLEDHTVLQISESLMSKLMDLMTRLRKTLLILLRKPYGNIA